MPASRRTVRPVLVTVQGKTAVSDVRGAGAREAVDAVMMARPTGPRVLQLSLKPAIPEPDGFMDTMLDEDRIPLQARQLQARQEDLKAIANEARRDGHRVREAPAEGHAFDRNRKPRGDRDRKTVEATDQQVCRHGSSETDQQVRQVSGLLKWILAKGFSSVIETGKGQPPIARNHVEGGVRLEPPIAIKNAIERRCF